MGHSRFCDPSVAFFVTPVQENRMIGTNTRPSLITVDEAARRLDVDRHTVYPWCRAGVFPHVRLGRAVIDPVRLEARLEAGGTANRQG